MGIGKAHEDSLRRLRAQVHIAKKDLQLDDDTYRSALKTATGKESSKDLSAPELSKVLAAFKQRGWKNQPARGRSPKSEGRVVDKLRAVWITMAQQGAVEDGSEPALEAWVKRQTSRSNGIGIDRVDWLDRDPKQAASVLESLKRWHKRVLDGWRNDDLQLISRTQTVEDRPQSDVVRDLLENRRIMYWPLFSELGIVEPDFPIRDRRLLQ